MKKSHALFAALSALVLGSCASVPPAGYGRLDTVKSLDLQRYLGRWYEIARLDNSFERGLVGTAAEYSLRPDGRVSVLNSGFKGSLDGPYKSAKGVAKTPDPAVPGRLKVSFFGPFWGDYLLFALADDYSWALVGDDSRRYLWLLARAPGIDDSLYAELSAKAAAAGFPADKLLRIPQKAR